jgi:O-antigen/teichoic acid export membrane protein
MSSAGVKRFVLGALVVISAATLIWRGSCLDWASSYRSRTLTVTALGFLLFSLVSLTPYGLLWVLSQFQYRNPLTYGIQFLLVAAPASLLLTSWRYETEGWGDFLVTLLQIAIALALLGFAFWYERRARRLPNQRLERP